jgi:hypothetical protein
MRPESGLIFAFDIAAPIATPIAIPIASHVPPDPKAASIAIPIPAPSAIPNPICIDGLFISFAPSCRPSETLFCFVCTRHCRAGLPYAALRAGSFKQHTRAGCPTLVAVLATGWGLCLFRPAICRRQYIGPQSLVADPAYFAQQLGHAHSRQ